MFTRGVVLGVVFGVCFWCMFLGIGFVWLLGWFIRSLYTPRLTIILGYRLEFGSWESEFREEEVMMSR